MSHCVGTGLTRRRAAGSNPPPTPPFQNSRRPPTLDRIMKAIDVHAHILGEDTMRLLQETAPQLGVKHTAIDAEFGVLEVAGTAYRPFPRRVGPRPPPQGD